MKVTALFCFGWILSLTAAGAAVKADSSTYSESYAILIKGSLAGTETVTEKTDENGNTISASEHEMRITDGLETKQMKFSTRMVLSKSTGIPINYSYWYTSGNTGDSYDVAIQNGQVTRVLNRGGRTSEVTVPLAPDMVFVDFDVYHQYDYLVRRYDFKKGGRQTFADFIPVIGNDIPVALTFTGEDTMDLKPNPLQIRNFRIEFVGIWGGMLSVDKEGRLVRLVIPAQDLEVVRRDLMPQQ
jgi:hypothetical protein